MEFYDSAKTMTKDGKLRRAYHLRTHRGRAQAKFITTRFFLICCSACIPITS